VSYVGNQGHREIVTNPTNTGNQALCLSLSQPSEVAPGSNVCGPFGESGTYTSAAGVVYHGTRLNLGSNYGPVTAVQSLANSNFNALEATLRYALGKRSTLLVGYTWSKSIDDASNVGEQINPTNLRLTRAISAFDIPQDLVITYNYALPFDKYFRKNRLTEGWSISGTTRFSGGFPVTLFDVSDNSLLGTLGNGINNQLLDTPQVVSNGPLQLNENPRNGQPVFNTSIFAPEQLGQLGDASRRIFHGPGLENFDVQISKNLRIRESQSLDIRVEAFNLLNHAQFFGPASVNGVVEDSNFGQVVSAMPPRLIQVAAKFHF
jgi:hypothetical protein